MIAGSFARLPRTHRALTLVAAVFVAIVAPRVYAQARIGVVDIRRAVAESAEGRAAFEALKTRYDDRQRTLDTKTKAIEGLKRSIEHPTPPVDQARLQKMAERYQRQVMELQQLGQQYTGELQGIEAELTKGILTKMQPIVRQIGQTDNYQLIVDEQVVHFAPTHLNLTDRVIQAYNQQYPLHGPVQLPDAGTGAPTGPATPDDPDPTPATAGDAGAPIDAARGPLPGVFFRRDSGH